MILKNARELLDHEICHYKLLNTSVTSIASQLTSAVSNEISPLLESGDLVKLRRNLVKQRLLHKALSTIERGILDLVIKLSVKPTSRTLKDTIAAIVEKARSWLKPTIHERAMVEGMKLAHANITIALKWGLEGARTWRNDNNYVLLLGLHSISRSNVKW